MVDTPAAPALATVAGVELGSAGYWDISNIKDWHPTSEDFAAAISALDCPAIRRPVLKFGHTAPAGEGDPTIGVIDNMRLTEDGQTLVGDFIGVPAWLAEADAEGRSVLSSAYPDRSGEWFFDHQCSLGHTHPFVLRAVALLGVWEPGIATLESLYDLYAKAPTKEVAVAKATVALAGTTTDQVRKAYYDGPGRSWDLWIREMFVDPPELIVQNDADDTIERVPYTVSGDGEVEFGEGQTVKVEYVAARAKAEKPAVAFASHAEARPKAAAASTTTSADPAEQGKEGAVPTVNLKDVAQLLELPADADDEAVSEALTNALKAKTDGAAAAGEDGAASTDAGADADDQVEAGGVLETPAQVAAAAKRLGLTVLDSATADTLSANASAGKEALQKIQREEDVKVVDAAISQGKIPPARRDYYLDELMVRDREGTTAFLASAPREAAVPMSEVGHATASQADTGENNPRLKEWNF